MSKALHLNYKSGTLRSEWPLHNRIFATDWMYAYFGILLISLQLLPRPRKSGLGVSFINTLLARSGFHARLHRFLVELLEHFLCCPLFAFRGKFSASQQEYFHFITAFDEYFVHRDTRYYNGILPCYGYIFKRASPEARRRLQAFENILN